MSVKNYDATALVQRMTDLYVDTIRYHSSHWQVLSGGHKGYGNVGSGLWKNVADDTIFITNIYYEVMRDLLAMEQSRPALATSLQAVTVSAFITAAQTQFTA